MKIFHKQVPFFHKFWTMPTRFSCVYRFVFLIKYLICVIIIIWFTIWCIPVTKIVSVRLVAYLLIYIVEVWFTVNKDSIYLQLIIAHTTLSIIKYQTFAQSLSFLPIDYKYEIWHTTKNVLPYQLLPFSDFEYLLPRINCFSYHLTFQKESIAVCYKFNVLRIFRTTWRFKQYILLP